MTVLTAVVVLLALRPDDGAIVSLVGGIGFDLSKFNRATQAQRQPGSNLKPFLYAAALDAGLRALDAQARQAAIDLARAEAIGIVGFILPQSWPR